MVSIDGQEEEEDDNIDTDKQQQQQQQRVQEDRKDHSSSEMSYSNSKSLRETLRNRRKNIGDPLPLSLGYIFPILTLKYLTPPYVRRPTAKRESGYDGGYEGGYEGVTNGVANDSMEISYEEAGNTPSRYISYYHIISYHIISS